MTGAGSVRPSVEGGWASDEAARRYVGERYRTRRAARRDARLVRRLLCRHADPLPVRLALDAPHGTGRLAPLVEGVARRWIGLDRSRAMLGEARLRHGAPLVEGSLASLPFPDARFDLVLCCRFLHHLDEERELGPIVRELVRVSRGLVIASFWDAGSLHAWRRKVGWRVDASGRRAIAKERLAAHLRSAGAEVLGYAHGLRGISQQTFVAARKLG